MDLVLLAEVVWQNNCRRPQYAPFSCWEVFWLPQPALVTFPNQDGDTTKTDTLHQKSPPWLQLTRLNPLQSWKQGSSPLSSDGPHPDQLFESGGLPLLPPSCCIVSEPPPSCDPSQSARPPTEPLIDGLLEELQIHSMLLHFPVTVMIPLAPVRAFKAWCCKSLRPSLMPPSIMPLHSPPARETRRAGCEIAGVTTVCLPRSRWRGGSYCTATAWSWRWPCSMGCTSNMTSVSGVEVAAEWPPRTLEANLSQRSSAPLTLRSSPAWRRGGWRSSWSKITTSSSDLGRSTISPPGLIAIETWLSKEWSAWPSGWASSDWWPMGSLLSGAKATGLEPPHRLLGALVSWTICPFSLVIGSATGLATVVRSHLPWSSCTNTPPEVRLMSEAGPQILTKIPGNFQGTPRWCHVFDLATALTPKPGMVGVAMPSCHNWLRKVLSAACLKANGHHVIGAPDALINVLMRFFSNPMDLSTLEFWVGSSPGLIVCMRSRARHHLAKEVLANSFARSVCILKIGMCMLRTLA